MNREETRKLIEVMQAYVDGKHIFSIPSPHTLAGTDEPRLDVNPIWNWEYIHYTVEDQSKRK
jgi:hypothetical protein